VNDSTTGIVTALHGLAISNWQHANIIVSYLRESHSGKQWFLLESIRQMILRRTGLATDGLEEAQLITGNVTLPRLPPQKEDSILIWV